MLDVERGFLEKNLKNFSQFKLDITFTDATSAMIEKEKLTQRS